MENRIEKIEENGDNMMLQRKKEHILKTYSPVQALIKFENVKTLPDIFKAEGPSLAAMKRDHGSRFVISYVGVWIINIMDFLNLKNSMSAKQIRETSYLILDNYKHLKIADINWIFKNAKLGNYGEIYNRIDGVIILTWFKKHFEERCNTAEDESLREHYENTRHEKDSRSQATYSKDEAFEKFEKEYRIKNLKM